jgi:hypothetical protein
MKILRMYVEVNQLKKERERDMLMLNNWILFRKKKTRNPNVQLGFALEGEKRN